MPTLRECLTGTRSCHGYPSVPRAEDREYRCCGSLIKEKRHGLCLVFLLPREGMVDGADSTGLLAINCRGHLCGPSDRRS